MAEGFQLQNFELIYAIGNRSLKEAAIYIRQGLDINYEDAFGKTALTEAIHTKDPNTVKFCLDNGANVNVTQPDLIYRLEKNTPLHSAAFYGILSIVRMLVENDAYLDAVSYFRTPLLVACGSLEERTWELQKSGLGANASGPFIPRHPYFHEDVAEYLINQGANIHVCDMSGRTALDLACKAGNLNIVKKLLSVGAIITDSTIYHARTREGRSEIEYFLKKYTEETYLVHISVEKCLETDRVVAKPS